MRACRQADDAGIGMILVIGITVFVAALSATAGVFVMNGLAQSRHRVAFEQALATAEAGIDFTLSHLQRAYDEGPRDYPVPDPGKAPMAGCSLPSITLPDWSGEVDPAAAERLWVDNWFEDKLATSAGRGCLMGTPAGQVMILKPAHSANDTPQYGRVYARGFSPSFSDPRALHRTIKAEYVFLPYQPSHAILTGTKLKLQSTSTEVTGVDSDSAKLAAVHTNGTLDVKGLPKVSGEVTVGVDSSGATSSNFALNPGGTPIVRPFVPIPRVSARQFYNQAPHQDSNAMNAWWDLCPDGKAKPYSEDGPCESETEWVAPYRGWSYDADSHTWTASKDTQSGTYFVHMANVANGNGNGSITNISVIASGTTDGCDKAYGNIVWDHYDTLNPAFKNLFFLADGDLSATSNFFSGSSGVGQVPSSGMYVAGEEILVWTSSSGLVGSVLAANQCDIDDGPVSTNEVQGQVIKFDPDGSSPFSSLISTTLWLEY